MTAGIRRGRREVFVLIVARHRRKREFVTQTEVDGQALSVDPPVVLGVEPVITEGLRHVANRLGRTAVRVTQQERGEGTAAGRRGHAGNAGFEEAETRLARDILLSEAVGALAGEGVPELQGVRAA